tara:strand:+ start:453 stop:770 length:318 start_codon:yes stop_codon:yes gene_type:complete
MIENRMINTRTKKLFPKAQKARNKMEAYQEKTFPFKISIWDSREGRFMEDLRFMTKSIAQAYLDRKCIKRGSKYYRKTKEGNLDMELEFKLKEQHPHPGEDYYQK